ncbi:MAG TPA: MarR family transcriptional regulator [Ramlibacter sp.]|nr:MarR family transcriptional regulator [Ramlibacter sp.]
MSKGAAAPALRRPRTSAKSSKSGRAAAASHRSRLSTEQSPYYQIWVLTNLTAKPFAAQFGSRFHLNLTEWRIMLTLADHPGASAQELSDYTGLDKMTLSRAVRALEAQGRLEREGSEEDRRKRHLWLTEEGWVVYDEIARAALAREAQIYAGLTENELKTLHRLLKKLSLRAREPAASAD